MLVSVYVCACVCVSSLRLRGSSLHRVPPEDYICIYAPLPRHRRGCALSISLFFSPPLSVFLYPRTHAPLSLPCRLIGAVLTSSSLLLLAPNGREVCAYASGPRKQHQHTTRRRKRNTRIERRAQTQGRETQGRSDALAPLFLLRVASSNFWSSAGTFEESNLPPPSPPPTHAHFLACTYACFSRRR